MAKVLVTGMSGTGKSTVLRALAARGHRAVDTDTERWSRWVTLPDGSTDWVWREDAVVALLEGHHAGHLFVAGCKSNQGRFHRSFDQVVLLSAPAEVLLSRIARRTDNPYGKRAEERAEILRNLTEVEPLLRATATAEIDASGPVEAVVGHLERLACTRVQLSAGQSLHHRHRGGHPLLP
ncbi:AAA family ATPase [Micromonospora sp. WMMD980]|uniref:AAA family ATPase n=1 Tax=Micromonospora sp. WMMD980 TaxID=3016088 RepID=UPI002417212D|nr:AAA family ATPase [Micromonospora sp. WMMD980]MDG4803120.1 AAA family ATPase [Micromonospora sp. WMMD980]